MGLVDYTETFLVYMMKTVFMLNALSFPEDKNIFGFKIFLLVFFSYYDRSSHSLPSFYICRRFGADVQGLSFLYQKYVIAEPR